MTTMNEERAGFEHWLGITAKGAAHDLGYEAFKAGAAWQRARVAVPDVSAMAKVLSDRAASACCVDPDDNWKIYGHEFIEDVRAMLAAAPAHLAALHEQGEVQRLREMLERATKLLSAAAGYATKMEPMPAKLLNAIDTALAATTAHQGEGEKP